MTPEEGSAESSGEQSPSATSVARRPPGRGRHSRGRRRPRRSGNQPRRLPAGSEPPPPESDAISQTEDPQDRDQSRDRQPSRDTEGSREGQRPREPLPPPFRPAKVESIQAAIEKVTDIIGNLREVLNEMELVLEYLEDAERQKITDEREIEILQQRLNSMHRRGDRHQSHSRPERRPPDDTSEAAD